MLPPPYSPRGMSPSNSRYSSGWSSVWTARLLRFGSSGMPRGTAHDSSTPSCSRRRSQCMLRAWCSWITNRPPGSASSGPPAGSGVASKSRFWRYLSRRSLTPPWWPVAGDDALRVSDARPQGDPCARPRLGGGDLDVVHEPVHEHEPSPALVGPARRSPLAFVFDDHDEPAVVVMGPHDQLAGAAGIRVLDHVGRRLVHGQCHLRPHLGRRALPVEPRPQRLANALQLPRLGGDPHLEVVRGPVLPRGHANRLSAGSDEVWSRHGAAGLAARSRSPHSPLMHVVFAERVRSRREAG